MRSFHAAVCRAIGAGRLPCGNVPAREMAGICLMVCLFGACDIDDERDVCCDRIVMEYRYLQDGEDAFGENIRSLRHFLFDGRDGFMKEVPPGSDMQVQILDPLETGRYTMVTVGNAAGATALPVPAPGGKMKDFVLEVQSAGYGNADLLYYGIREFTLVKESGNSEQRFVTQLANVHCKLTVTVKWQNLPPLLTKEPVYRMELENCAEHYELDGDRGYGLGDKHFPYAQRWGRLHRRDCSLEGLQLKEEFVSLRYTNENLPVLRIYCKEDGTGTEYVEQTPALDLKKAFAAWGYRPAGVERQEYKIIVTIYLDGHVGIKVEAEAGVADWVDGGAFG